VSARTTASSIVDATRCLRERMGVQGDVHYAPTYQAVFGALYARALASQDNVYPESPTLGDLAAWADEAACVAAFVVEDRRKVDLEVAVQEIDRAERARSAKTPR
jgi:hypothetical protein